MREGHNRDVRRRIAAAVAWLGLTVLAGALVADAVRICVTSVASPARLEASRGALPRHRPLPPAAGAHPHGPPAGGGATSPTNERREGSPARERIDMAHLPAFDPSSRSSGAPPATAGTATAAGADTTTPVPPDTAVSTTSVASEPTTTTSTTTTSAPSSTTTSTTSVHTAFTYRLRGGTVGIECSGDTVSLKYATPNSGYTTTVTDPGPTVVDVRFDDGGATSEVRVTCSGGQPDAEIHESRG